MARKIDLTKPLSEADAAYVSQRPWLQAEIDMLAYNEKQSTKVYETPEDEDDEDLTLYEDFSVSDLKEALAARDLSVSGNKAALIARLTEDDESEEEDLEDDESEEDEEEE